MGSHVKTIRLVILSVVATMVVMRLVSMIPGFFIPARYYLASTTAMGIRPAMPCCAP